MLKPVSRALPLFVTITLIFGCADEDTSVSCGEGTVAQDGWCRVSDAGHSNDSGTLVGCGTGTIVIDGECRPASAQCGEDTVLTDSGCASTPDADSLDVGHDSSDSRDARSDTDDCVLQEDEWCDGLDNDCDGVIDEGHVCPDWTVRHTDPFYDAVYFAGLTSSTCEDHAIQQVWPTAREDYYSGFPCKPDVFTFSLSDGLLYFRGRSGLYRLVEEGGPLPIATPPCAEEVKPIFSFDGDGRLHYRCDNTLRRSNGELVRRSIRELVVTLDDGRIVVSLGGPRGDVYALLDEDGNILSTLDAHRDFVGEMTLVPKGATKSGNNAYVLFERRWGQRQKEYVAYRSNEQNRWQLMRRVEVDEFDLYALVISDGTIFTRRIDNDNRGVQTVRAYRPDAGLQVVLHEDDMTDEIFFLGERQLLVGPRDTPQP